MEDCFGAEVFAGDFPDEDLDGAFLGGMTFYVKCLFTQLGVILGMSIVVELEYLRIGGCVNG